MAMTIAADARSGRKNLMVKSGEIIWREKPDVSSPRCSLHGVNLLHPPIYVSTSTMVAARSLSSVAWIFSILGFSIAFQSQHYCMRKSAAIFSSASDVEEFLAANFPACSALLAKNADVMKKIIKADDGFTIFAPNSDAFAALGEKKRAQLDDIRNAEVGT